MIRGMERSAPTLHISTPGLKAVAQEVEATLEAIMAEAAR